MARKSFEDSHQVIRVGWGAVTSGSPDSEAWIGSSRFCPWAFQDWSCPGMETLTFQGHKSPDAHHHLPVHPFEGMTVKRGFHWPVWSLLGHHVHSRFIRENVMTRPRTAARSLGSRSWLATMWQHLAWNQRRETGFCWELVVPDVTPEVGPRIGPSSQGCLALCSFPWQDEGGSSQQMVWVQINLLFAALYSFTL